ncbi:MAG: hypothetical protein OXJ56_10065 [Rhodospirillaceae bacterium]|nr:hypothetical protein [Rhodospirillaceae bacterium]
MILWPIQTLGDGYLFRVENYGGSGKTHYVSCTSKSVDGVSVASVSVGENTTSSMNDLR